MEENEAAVEQIPPSVKVLLNAELLDTIFGFVETPILLNLRSICKKWRSVTNLALKRRLNISTIRDYWAGPEGRTNVLTFSNLEKVKYTFEVPEGISSNALTVSPQSRDPKERGAFFGRDYACLPTSPIVSVLLEQPWISQLTKVKLKDCLTLDEWNAVGCYIVSKFTSLSNLSVRLQHGKTPVLPLCYQEISSQPLDDETKFEKLTELEVFCGKKGLSKVTNISYEILSRSPNLKRFKSDISWSSSEDDYHMPGYTASAQRTKLAQGDASDCCQCNVRSKTKLAKPTVTFNRIFVQDAIKILKVMQPLRALEISLNLNLLASIPPIYLEQVDTLTLRHDSLDEAPITAVIPTLRAISSVCRNVKKMSLKCNPSDMTGQLNFANMAPGKTKFEKISILQLDRDLTHRNSELRTPILKSWQRQKIYTVAPNVELLSMNFFKGELLKILKLATKCLSFGLTSITIILCDPLLLEDYTKAFVKACTGIDSMRQLRVYSQDGPEDEYGADRASPVQLSTLGITIPSNLEVMTGPAYMLLHEEATFINLQDPDLTWKQLKGDEGF